MENRVPARSAKLTCVWSESTFHTRNHTLSVFGSGSRTLFIPESISLSGRSHRAQLTTGLSPKCRMLQHAQVGNMRKKPAIGHVLCFNLVANHQLCLSFPKFLTLAFAHNRYALLFQP